MILFSIIVPAYNAAGYVEENLRSLLEQGMADDSFEVLAIDDCSLDSTYSIIQGLEDAYPGRLRAFRTKENSGPGIARNVGLAHARGEWILFMDSDDRLAEGALAILREFIATDVEGTDIDAIAINWHYDTESSVESDKKYGRYDLMCLTKSKVELIRDFISLGMDGSVIYTVAKRDLIERNGLVFFDRFHEDVDFIFKIYYHSKRIAILDRILYIKNNRDGSIVNTVTVNHIEGYSRAFREIASVLVPGSKLFEQVKSSLYLGILGFIAVKLREISISKLPSDRAGILYRSLYDNFLRLSEYTGDLSRTLPDTKYVRIARHFIREFKERTGADDSFHMEMNEFIASIIKKSWSCYDLHHSIFLAPDEIRTCCKRFFVDGKRKGDVVILKSESDSSHPFRAEDILREKRDLYTLINRGASESCAGCPFLEFKEWGYINELEIENVSFEYHSICNMRCQYCSDTYYSGKGVSYNVQDLVDELIDDGSFASLKSVVWGGGEPVLDRLFDPIIQRIADGFPAIKQRVITNSSVYSKKIEDLLRNDRITITTSVDAGTPDKFREVRGNPKFDDVFNNLVKYAAVRPGNVTVKYIILQNNSSHDELLAFSKNVASHSLAGCNFQISCDFTSEKIDLDLVIAGVSLFGMLMDLDCRIVFFDELLRQRIPDPDEKMMGAIISRLEDLGLRHAVADPADYPSVIIWGAGIQTKTLLDHSSFFKKTKVEYIVDSSLGNGTAVLFGHPVYGPEKLADSDVPVLISAVQSTPFIYEEFLGLGLDRSRLIRSLVI